MKMEKILLSLLILGSLMSCKKDEVEEPILNPWWIGEYDVPNTPGNDILAIDESQFGIVGIINGNNYIIQEQTNIDYKDQYYIQVDETEITPVVDTMTCPDCPPIWYKEDFTYKLTRDLIYSKVYNLYSSPDSINFTLIYTTLVTNGIVVRLN